MRCLRNATLAVALAVSTPAYSDPVPVSYLVKACVVGDQTECQAYLIGVWDVLGFVGPKHMVCGNPDVSDLVKAFIQLAVYQDPNRSAADIASIAFYNHYRCPDGDK